MVKWGHFCLDLGLLKGDEEDRRAIIEVCALGGGRVPPLLPDEYVAALEAKTFTNGKDDPMGPHYPMAPSWPHGTPRPHGPVQPHGRPHGPIRPMGPPQARTTSRSSRSSTAASSP